MENYTQKNGEILRIEIGRLKKFSHLCWRNVEPKREEEKNRANEPTHPRTQPGNLHRPKAASHRFSCCCCCRCSFSGVHKLYGKSMTKIAQVSILLKCTYKETLPTETTTYTQFQKSIKKKKIVLKLRVGSLLCCHTPHLHFVGEFSFLSFCLVGPS